MTLLNAGAKLLACWWNRCSGQGQAWNRNDASKNPRFANDITTRAALTGLRKRGYTVTIDRTDKERGSTYPWVCSRAPATERIRLGLMSRQRRPPLGRSRRRLSAPPLQRVRRHHAGAMASGWRWGGADRLDRVKAAKGDEEVKVRRHPHISGIAAGALQSDELLFQSEVGDHGSHKQEGPRRL
jgi:hypothetical protein